MELIKGLLSVSSLLGAAILVLLLTLYYYIRATRSE